MRRVKYLGGLTKLITSELGNLNKKKFSRFIQDNLHELKTEIGTKKIEIDVVSFSSSKDFQEQILSILSFLKFAGTPTQWTLYSDGTHTQNQIQFLKKNFEFIEVKRTEFDDLKKLKENCKDVLLPYLDALSTYAKLFPLGKKLLNYLNHIILTPTLFLDSDILFYNKASLFDTLLTDHVNGWFLPDDDWGCLDSRYKAKNMRQLYQVNSGFFLLNRELTQLTKGLNFLKSLDGKYEYFSEQTVYHILFNDNNFMPLDPRIFILNSEDQFDFSYILPKEKMAIRHYTGTVRHKMWQRDWKWQLSLQ